MSFEAEASVEIAEEERMEALEAMDCASERSESRPKRRC